MTISEIITLRTGLTDAETIASYVDLAEAKVRAYLNYEPSDSVVYKEKKEGDRCF